MQFDNWKNGGNLTMMPDLKRHFALNGQIAECFGCQHSSIIPNFVCEQRATDRARHPELCCCAWASTADFIASNVLAFCDTKLGHCILHCVCFADIQAKTCIGKTGPRSARPIILDLSHCKLFDVSSQYHNLQPLR